jgi:hypothetical protein
MATELVHRGVAGLKRKGQAILAGFPRILAWAEAAADDFVVGPPRRRAKGTARFRYLAFWQPGPPKRGKVTGRRKLKNWLQHALYGDRKPLWSVQPNKVRNGLLYPIMAAEGALKIDKKAFQVCCSCGSTREYDGSPCADCLKRDGSAPYVVRGEDMLLVPGQYLPKAFRRFWPVAIPQPVQARLRPSEKKNPAKNLRLYTEESLYQAGTPPIKAKKFSQRPTTLFVKQAFASLDGIARAMGALAGDPLGRLHRALALLPEIQRTTLLLWAEDVDRKVRTAEVQEALDALERQMEELDDGWPGDSDEQ